MSAPSKRPPGHVSTPNLGLASPAPRSVPSPTATRKDQAGKTPVNIPTVSSQGSKTLGSTPMMQNLSQTGFTTSSSPGTHGASFGTPLAGLGVDMGSITPGLLNLPTPLAGAAMLPTMSELGLTPSGAKRNEDEERRAKMRRVLKSIGRPKGRVSEEGIARIARRIGLQNDIDAEVLTPEERARKVGNRTIGIAGKTVVIEVDLRENMAHSVRVFLSGTVKALEEQGAMAAQVLLRDLTFIDQASLDAKLDRFAANLDRLARTDRLSNQVNCYEALSGMYSSLRKLHGLEKEAVRRDQKVETHGSDKRAEMEVLRKRSGCASIHGRGQIGMAIDYWTTNAPILDEPATDAMEMDGTGASLPGDAGDGRYSLRIETEAFSAALYPAARISDAWLGDGAELPAPGSGLSIPWEDPPPTFAAQPGQEDSMDFGAASKLPDVRFVARLDPPVIVPYQTAMTILTTLGLPPPQPYACLPYHTMLLNIPTQVLQGNVLGTISAEQKVLSLRDDAETEVTHHYQLDVPKADYGYKLEDLPFSHPRQLTDVLPILRQWAHFGALVRNALREPAHSTPNGDTNGVNGASKLSLDTLMMGDADVDVKLHLNMGLVTIPSPTLSLTFADAEGTTVSSVVAQIGPNADVSVVHHEGFKPAEDATDVADAVAVRLAKALEVCGDIGVWVEWMRQQQSG